MCWKNNLKVWECSLNIFLSIHIFNFFCDDQMCKKLTFKTEKKLCLPTKDKTKKIWLLKIGVWKAIFKFLPNDVCVLINLSFDMALFIIEVDIHP